MDLASTPGVVLGCVRHRSRSHLIRAMRPKISTLAWTATAALATACASGGPGSDPVPPPAAEQSAAAPTPAANPAPDGPFFSATQVERGGDLFSDICSECHYASEMSDANFRFAWRRQSVGDLFELVSETMPESSPGGLEPGQYADVVAYILSLNGFDPGDQEMPADAAALEMHSLSSLSN